ncbi:MAG TPA: hypothetical protein VIM62_13420 [Acidobacteriaceae bacterium]
MKYEQIPIARNKDVSVRNQCSREKFIVAGVAAGQFLLAHTVRISDNQLYSIPIGRQKYLSRFSI